MQENPTTITVPPEGPRSGRVLRDGGCGFHVMPWRCPSWCTAVHEDKLDWPPTHEADVAGYHHDWVHLIVKLSQDYDEPAYVLVFNSSTGEFRYGERYMRVPGRHAAAFAALLTTLGRDDIGALIVEAADILAKGSAS